LNKIVNRTASLLMAILLLPAVAACGAGGEQATADDIQITLTASPPGETTSYLVVHLTGPDDQPVTDATVTVEGNMNHAGMVPVLADPVRDDADGTVDGSYRIPFQFTMLGDWIITVSVERPDGSEVEQNIEVTVGDQGVNIR
jgi:hypothetical protein